jgi:hypothetical protein
MWVTRLTLAQVLARITSEYGPTFANITEENLQVQIDKQQSGDVEMEDVPDKDDSKKPITREELIKIVQYRSRPSSLRIKLISTELRLRSPLSLKILCRFYYRPFDPLQEGRLCHKR